MGYHELLDETPETFLDALFNRDDEVLVGPSSAVGVFDLSARRTRWILDTGNAASMVGSTDVFYGTTLHDPKLVARIASERKQKSPRWYKESATHLASLWLDVDVATGEHKKKGLFASDEDALEFLYSLPVPPSFIIKTGGGFHAYWRLSSIITIGELDGGTFRAQAIVQAWQDFCRSEAKTIGIEIDATHDLARMLRVPGTLNGKYGPEKNRAVAVATDDVPSLSCSPMVDLSTIEVLCSDQMDELEAEMAAPHNEESGDATGIMVGVGANAEIPVPVKILIELSSDFASVWKRQRADLPSQSEYDLSIASTLTNRGLSDQDIVDALVIHRSLGGYAPKDRPDYYARTIAVARRSSEQGEKESKVGAEVKAASDRLDDDAANAALSKPGRTDDERLSDVNRHLGGRMCVVRVLKYVGDPSVYKLETTHGSVTLSGIDDLLRAPRFRSKVADASTVTIPVIKAKRWERIAEVLTSIVEDVDLGDEGDPAKALAESIRAYLDETRAGGDRDDAMSARMPWRDETSGEVWISIGPLVRWLHSAGEAVQRADVARLLRQLGSEPKTFAFHVSGGASQGNRTTASYWLVSTPVSSGADQGAVSPHPY